MAAQPIVAAAVKTRIFVAAIDFGTTFSGYAYSFRDEFLKNPLKIITNNWNIGHDDTRGMSLKTSSCVLFDSEQKFHSFGYDAEDHYAELAANEQHYDWFYFKRFKMHLYNNKDLTRETELFDDLGHKMLAIKVFSAGIRYLKDHLVQSVTVKTPELSIDDIHWVLTVPAIWEDSAKQFMREAAIQAGIDTNHLSLALEPEAASLFCKYLPVERVTGEDGVDMISKLAPGKRYLVLDAGGGTVDITVHETQEDSTVREIYKANGGPWGGTTVDESFMGLLDDIAGQDTMEIFIKEYKEDYLILMREFEVKKKTFGPQLGSSKVQFRIPVSVHTAYSLVNGQDFRRSLMMKQELKDNVTFTGDKLRVQPEQVMELFEETCQRIIDHLKDILSKPEVAGVETILMVGGFSESKMLQHYIKEFLPHLVVVIPEEAGLAVLKGAVIFGHNPNAIVSRVMKYTYGIAMYTHFIKGKHPESKKVVLDGIEKCDDCFDIHVSIGQEIIAGKSFGEKGYRPATKDTKKISLKVYTSTKTKPKFVDDEGCHFLGKLEVDLSHIGKYEDRNISVHMKYGGTELEVEAKLNKTGEVLTASLNFLG